MQLHSYVHQSGLSRRQFNSVILIKVLVGGTQGARTFTLEVALQYCYSLINYVSLSL
jgi:hypothetical protein